MSQEERERLFGRALLLMVPVCLTMHYLFPSPQTLAAGMFFCLAATISAICRLLALYFGR